MGTEMMRCCGALTKVYSDAGNRKHKPTCKLYRGDGTIEEPTTPDVVEEVFTNTITGRSRVIAAKSDERYARLKEQKALLHDDNNDDEVIAITIDKAQAELVAKIERWKVIGERQLKDLESIDLNKLSYERLLTLSRYYIQNASQIAELKIIMKWGEVS